LVGYFFFASMYFVIDFFLGGVFGWRYLLNTRFVLSRWAQPKIVSVLAKAELFFM